jgi:DNA-damage-inducible protein J
MSQINVRVEEKTKKAASKALADIGLDMSSAVNMFLKQVITEQGLPFTPSKTKRDPKKIRAEWDKEVAWALKHGKRYSSAEEMLKDIL